MSSVSFLSVSRPSGRLATTPTTARPKAPTATIFALCFLNRFFAASAKEVGSPSSGVGSLGVESFTRTHLPEPSLTCQAITRHHLIK
ncbi:hypothetical protein SNL152K_3977 [Streptomyces sp. NL15-2K]|nr:hypothetical protein SNL152K_3977 [Streptomyces sp. NL15-2K]